MDYFIAIKETNKTWSTTWSKIHEWTHTPIVSTLPTTIHSNYIFMWIIKIRLTTYNCEKHDNRAITIARLPFYIGRGLLFDGCTVRVQNNTWCRDTARSRHREQFFSRSCVVATPSKNYKRFYKRVVITFFNSCSLSFSIGHDLHGFRKIFVLLRQYM